MFLLPIIFITLVATETDVTWDYDSKSQWPTLCKEGRFQSPVNLDKLTVQYDTKLPGLHFDNYNELYNCSVISTKHTVEVHFDYKNKKLPAVHHGNIPGYYILQNIHFHWTSEHTIDGKRYPFEMHFVHYDVTMGNFANALKVPKGIAVLGVIFEESPITNKRLDPLTSLMVEAEKIELDKETNLAMEMRPNMFLPENTENFYRYIGSLTSPNCNEDVVWTIFTKTSDITKEQKEFFEIFKMGPVSENGTNAREIQDLFGRMVIYRGEYYSSGSILKPSIMLALLLKMYFLLVHT